MKDHGLDSSSVAQLGVKQAPCHFMSICLSFVNWTTDESKMSYGPLSAILPSRPLKSIHRDNWKPSVTVHASPLATTSGNDCAVLVKGNVILLGVCHLHVLAETAGTMLRAILLNTRHRFPFVLFVMDNSKRFIAFLSTRDLGI